jgi:hypothetical protein
LSVSSSSNGAAASSSALGSAAPSLVMAAGVFLASIALTRFASAAKIGADFSRAVINFSANADPPEKVGGSNGFNFAAVSPKMDPKLPYRVTRPDLILVGSLDLRLGVTSFNCPTIGVKPVQNVDSQAALCTSKPPEVLPTVVVGAFEVRDELDVLAALEAVSELLVGASLDAAGLVAPVTPAAAELAGDVLDAASLAEAVPEDIALEDTATEDIELDDVAAALELGAGAAMPLLELHPVRSTAAPVSAAIRVVRFIGAPFCSCSAAGWGGHWILVW